ncbi:hypothetical protein [Streptomyces sp. NPDC046197]|uniref:hypothetical protein n=1 Tax=Streptomyces sp. NPDC046197 TaxID=3154337 RepID=UPI0033E01B18
MTPSTVNRSCCSGRSRAQVPGCFCCWTHFADMRISRPNTIRALRALDGAVHQEPSPSDEPAARAARIAAQSRERSKTTAPAAPRTHPAADQVRQAHDSSAQQHQPGVRPA